MQFNNKITMSNQVLILGDIGSYLIKEPGDNATILYTRSSIAAHCELFIEIHNDSERRIKELQSALAIRNLTENIWTNLSVS